MCPTGRCFKAVDSMSDEESKLIAIDEEANHQIVHGDRFGKAPIRRLLLCCRGCQAPLCIFSPPFWTRCDTGPRLLWRLPVVWEPRISHDGLSVRALTLVNHFSMHLGA